VKAAGWVAEVAAGWVEVEREEAGSGVEGWVAGVEG
jgi:hypothetical protein